MEKSHFIFGNIKYNLSENKGKQVLTCKNDVLEVYKKKCETIIETNSAWLKSFESKLPKDSWETVKRELTCVIEENTRKIQYIDYLNKELFSYRPTKIVHGYCGILTENYVYLTMQTSSRNSKILGAAFSENIPVDEELNPVKSVNVLQKIPVQLFRSLFKITDPLDLLHSPRFEGHSDKDLAYCFLRAFVKSLQHSNNMLVLKEIKPELIGISKESTFTVDEAGGLKLPGQYAIEQDLNDCAFTQDLVRVIELGASDGSFKENLIKEACDGYSALTKIKYDF